MRKSIRQLIQALEKTSEVYAEVLELGDKKQQAVIKGEIKELEKITATEQGLVASLLKLEDIREQIMLHVMKDLGIASAEKLDDILPHLSADEQDLLGGSKRKLQNLVSDVQNMNETSEMLIQKSLEMVEFNMNLIGSIGKDEPNYGDRGKVNYDDDKRSMFDVKV